MASVVICPHCHLQLFAPDGIEEDARVGCPTCREQFDLGQARPRALPEVVRVGPSSFQTTTSRVLSGDELPATSDQATGEGDPDLTVDLLRSSFSPAADESTSGSRDESKHASSPASAVTLADLMSPTAKRGDVGATLSSDVPELRMAAPGPTFELPDVPLSNDLAATIELSAASQAGFAANTDFEFDDAELGASDANLASESTVTEESDVTVEMHEGVKAAAGRSDRDTFNRIVDGKFDVADRTAAPAIAPLVGRRRRPSRLVTFTGFVLFSLAGLAAGYYILLHLLGPTGDFLGVAKYLPTEALPASFAAEPPQLAAADKPVAPSIERGVQRGGGIDSRTRPADFDGPAELPTELAAESPAQDAVDATDSSGVADEREYGVDRTVPDTPSVERDRAEPARFERESAAQESVVAPKLIGGSSYTIDQLAALLVEAKAAQAGLMEGDLSDPAVRRTKGRSYTKLCDLAEAWTRCDATTTRRFDQLERDVESLFHSTLADEHTRREVARIVTIWIRSPSRRHGGIFLAGTAGAGQIAGEVYEYPLESDAGNVRLILVPQPLAGRAAATAATIGIVGTLVDKPAENITGYAGEAEQAIWVRTSIPLD